MLLNHPGPGDLVSHNNHFAGYGTGFEGQVNVRIVEEDGTTIGSGFAQSSGGMGVIGEFLGEITLSQNPSGKRGFIEAWSDSGKGEGEQPSLVRVPIVFS